MPAARCPKTASLSHTEVPTAGGYVLKEFEEFTFCCPLPTSPLPIVHKE
jgi:hypothetical protein